MISLRHWFSWVISFRQRTSVRWTVADLIDFDHYIDCDQQQQNDHKKMTRTLAERDRYYYLNSIQPHVADIPEHTVTHRRLTLRYWLELRRQSEPEAVRLVLPGASFVRAQRLIMFLLAFLGVIAGGTVASALLSYDGQQPVNVMWYLFILVGLQLLLAAITTLFWLFHHTAPIRHGLQDIFLLIQLGQPIWLKFVNWIQNQRLQRLSRQSTTPIQSQLATVQAHKVLYGAASYMAILIPIQILGLGFNGGAIGMTLLIEGFSDLAFGWGTAFNIEPQLFYHIVRTIAIPWRWLFEEGVGYPTLEAIEGTRIFLKDPLAWSDAVQLRSWRWFLVFAVIVYGLIPRLVLICLSWLTQYRALNCLPFTHHRTQSLYARLLTPRLETNTASSGVGPAMPIPSTLSTVPPTLAMPSGTDQIVDKAPSKVAPAAVVVAKPSEQSSHRIQPLKPKRNHVNQNHLASDACLLLLHSDIADILVSAHQSLLRQRLLACAGWHIGLTVHFGRHATENEQAIAQLAATQWQAPPPRVVLLQDGSQPPITEYLRFLQRVRSQIGDHAQLLLTLIGDPTDDDPLPPIRDFDLIDWQRKIEQLADPYLRLAPFTLEQDRHHS
jgi:hypothetical protein